MTDVENTGATALAAVLASLPVEQWQVKRLGIVGWYDGPTEGICELALPACAFYFELWAERFRADDVDDRLFRLSTLPRSAIDRLWATVDEWEAHKDEIDELRSSRTLTRVIVRTDDWECFTAYWELMKG
jgi:hypothetical protein